MKTVTKPTPAPKANAPKAEDPKAEAPKAEAPKAEAKPTKVRVIKVLKNNAKFRGAREAWYNELKAHDGKPLADYEKATKDKPPSVPKSGRAEAPSGWVSYFKRTGILQVEEKDAQ